MAGGPYLITRNELERLADLIADMDGPGNNEAAAQAHRMIANVLGADEALVYKPLDDEEAA